MGRKPQQRRSEAEVAALRAARAERKTRNDDDAGVQMGALTLEFHDNLKLTVEEDWHCEGGDAIAGLQWAGGVRLARFFDDRDVYPLAFWREKRVLELGAGQGLTSCLLATLGCQRVVCTDADVTHALQTLARNADVLPSPPDVVNYSWGAGEPPLLADVIVCGDCLYAEAHAHLLVRGLIDCCTPETVVFLCGTVGEDAYRAFLKEAPKHFDVEILDGAAQRGVSATTWGKRDLLRLVKRSPGPSLLAITPGRKDKLVGEDASVFDNVSDGETCVCDATSEDITTNARALLDPWPGHRSVLIIDGVLSEKACAELIACSSSRGSFWAGDDPHADARAFRDADTCEVHCPRLAAKIYQRIAPFLATVHIAMPEDEHVEVRGAWRPCGVNDDFLFGRYPARGGFAPHSDGATARGLNRRSFYSVIVYLNAPEEGGGTRFYASEAAATGLTREGGRWTGRRNLAAFEVTPQRGRALIFDQRLVHEGVPADGQKHIIRTDVLFERLEPLFLGTEAAYADYERAVDLSERGDHVEAVKLFQKVARISPDLAGALGI